MAIKILVHNPQLSTAGRTGYPMIRSTSEADRGDFVVRWGVSTDMSTDHVRIINHKDAVALCVNKLQFLKSMPNGVPPTWEDMIPEGKWGVMRKIEHAAGSDFALCRGPYAIPRGYFATEFMRTDNEYRIWFCSDRAVSAKRANSRDTGPVPVRSGWGYVGNRDATPNQLSCIANIRNAVEHAAGGKLYTGAADVLFMENPDRYVILEVNTAPAVDQPFIETFYRSALNELQASLSPRPANNPAPAGVRSRSDRTRPEWHF